MRKTTEDNPINCIIRSEIVAPGTPSQLRTKPARAFVKIGSSADQLVRAIASKSVHPTKARPNIFENARLSTKEGDSEDEAWESSREGLKFWKLKTMSELL